MISQKCPRCNSNRVRRGYRHTPVWSRIICRYYLLCDNCNWEFTGFAVPGTTSAKPTRRPRKSSGSSGESEPAGADKDKTNEKNARDGAQTEEETASSERRGLRMPGAAMLF